MNQSNASLVNPAIPWWYSFAVTVIGAAIAPVFLIKEWRSGRGLRAVFERFGWWGSLPEGSFVWFHGASVGEVNSLSPLVAAWRTRFPSDSVVITATTTTGVKRAQRETPYAYLLPLDTQATVARALSAKTPRAFLFGETELWPNLITFLGIRQVPIFLVNGRVSARSCRRYRLVAQLVRTVLCRITHLCISHESSCSRFVALGAPAERCSVTGNAKYDVLPRYDRNVEAKAELFNSDGPLLVLGCIRPAEETLWFPLLKRVLGLHPDLKVVIAPRHPEKFDYFAYALQSARIPYARFTAGVPCNSSILLLDVLGKLEEVYRCADISWVGGTLLPEHGGHNPLEAAMYANALIAGPHGHTIQEIREDLCRDDALHTIANVEEGVRLLDSLLSNPADMRARGARALQCAQRYRGATERIMSVVEAAL